MSSRPYIVSSRVRWSLWLSRSADDEGVGSGIPWAGNEEEERQHNAARFLQKHARGFLTTLRMRRARFVVRSWRRQQNASMRTCLTLWMHKRQNLETRIKVMAEARRKLLKRRSWREWVGLVVVRTDHLPAHHLGSIGFDWVQHNAGLARLLPPLLPSTCFQPPTHALTSHLPPHPPPAALLDSGVPPSRSSPSIEDWTLVRAL